MNFLLIAENENYKQFLFEKLISNDIVVDKLDISNTAIVFNSDHDFETIKDILSDCLNLVDNKLLLYCFKTKKFYLTKDINDYLDIEDIDVYV